MGTANGEKVINATELRAALEDEPEELADLASDPLYRATALARSDYGDLADRHDEYLYES